MGWGGVDWIRWLRIGTGDWLLQRGNEATVSIKDGEFFDQLYEYHFLKKDSTPWS
jgi:hypothetical protein